MPSINQIRFDTSGWQLAEKSVSVVSWLRPVADGLSLSLFNFPPDTPPEVVNQTAARIEEAKKNTFPDFLSLNFFDVPPDIPASLDDLSALRSIKRKKVNSMDMGLISLDIVELNGIRAQKLILRKLLSEYHCSVYLASYTLPFADFSYVIKIQCKEAGITGLRENEVLGRAMKAGVNIEFVDGKMTNWNTDSFSDMNLSETEEYDPVFPNHPLTRARRCLDDIAASLQLDRQVVSAKTFKFLGR